MRCQVCGRHIDCRGARRKGSGEAAIAGARTEEALKRLETALVRLEAAAELKAEADGTVEALVDDRARLERDRATLAAKLDVAEARADALAETNREVAARLVKVMERVRRLAPEDGR